MPTAALCTRAQVKAFGNISGIGSDDLIDARIPVALQRLNLSTGREFMPRSTETRTFDVYDACVYLHGCDLRTATTVILHPESVTEARTLVAGTDYILDVDRLTGTAGMIRLSDRLCLVSNRYVNFGHAQLSVAGEWGVWEDVADVAADVNAAAIECVLSWTDKAVEGAAQYQLGTGGNSQPSMGASWDIPFSAWRKMLSYSRLKAVVA